jgi:hypothetical protein
VRDVGGFAVVVLSPEFAAVASADEIGFDGDVVFMLDDAADEKRIHLEGLADFLWIVLFALVAKHGAPRHDFEVGQLREAAD